MSVRVCVCGCECGCRCMLVWVWVYSDFSKVLDFEKSVYTHQCIYGGKTSIEKSEYTHTHTKIILLLKRIRFWKICIHPHPRYWAGCKWIRFFFSESDVAGVMYTYEYHVYIWFFIIYTYIYDEDVASVKPPHIYISFFPYVRTNFHDIHTYFTIFTYKIPYTHVIFPTYTHDFPHTYIWFCLYIHWCFTIFIYTSPYSCIKSHMHMRFSTYIFSTIFIYKVPHIHIIFHVHIFHCIHSCIISHIYA